MAAATPLTSQARHSHSDAKILIDGESFDDRRLAAPSQAQPFQDAMDRARHKFGHALCACRRPPLKLQIRLRDGKYHLAVWPEEGHLHDSNCLFFRDEQGQRDEPSHIAAGTAAAANQPRDVHFAYPFERQFLQAGVKNAPRAPSAHPPTAEPASLEDLFKILWTDSSLCRWHPTWTRDWGRTRYQLLQTAEDIIVDGEPLARHLFVPRPYRENQRSDLNHEWDSFVDDLSRSVRGVVKAALLVAPVRSIATAPNGQTILRLRHLRAPIGLPEGVVEHLGRNCRNALKRIEANEADRLQAQERGTEWKHVRVPEVVAMALVEPSSRQGLWARAAWLMQTHPAVFIPANNPAEVMLVDALLEGGYQFSRILTADKPSARSYATWIMHHAIDPQGKRVPRVALEIMSHGASEEYRARRAQLVDDLARTGIPTWTWTPVGSPLRYVVPTLPPHEDTPGDRLLKVLAKIRETDTLFYAYGSGLQSHQ